MQVDLQVEVPKGFELTGEYRPPRTDEWFLRWDGQQIKSTYDWPTAFLILRKVDTWRDATLDDLKRVMDGETVECRCIDGTQTHTGFRLAGWNTNSFNRPVWAMIMIHAPGSLYYGSNVQVKE